MTVSVRQETFSNHLVDGVLLTQIKLHQLDRHFLKLLDIGAFSDVLAEALKCELTMCVHRSKALLHFHYGSAK